MAKVAGWRRTFQRTPYTFVAPQGTRPKAPVAQFAWWVCAHSSTPLTRFAVSHELHRRSPTSRVPVATSACRPGPTRAFPSHAL
eukprot:9485871-Pyramimonas_sp.AAC.1